MNNSLRRLLAVSATTICLGASIPWAPPAQAEDVSGCEQIRGFWFGKGTARNICDGVRRPDGSWLRLREFFSPSYYRNASSSCSGGAYYSNCTFYPGGQVPRYSNGVEDYIVFDYNVLPDEPGHLENGFRV